MKTKVYYTKLAATLDSRNFFVSLITLFLLVLQSNDLDPGTDAETIFDAIMSGDLGNLLALFLVNFLNPIMKIVRGEVGWSWNFLKSKNFWFQAATALIVGLTMFGIVFPEGAAAAIIDAIFTGDSQAIMVAFVVNIINPIWHFFTKQKELPPPKQQIGKPLPTQPVA